MKNKLEFYDDHCGSFRCNNKPIVFFLFKDALGELIAGACDEHLNNIKKKDKFFKREMSETEVKLLKLL